MAVKACLLGAELQVPALLAQVVELQLQELRLRTRHEEPSGTSRMIAATMWHIFSGRDFGTRFDPA